MILGFSINLNEKPTYFPEKILSGMLKNSEKKFKNIPDFIYDYGYFADYDSLECVLEKIENSTPKIHTIRDDKKDRWKTGKNIDFFVNVRKPDMFRFAPTVPVVSTQGIKIKYTKSSNDTDLIYVEVFGVNDWKCLGTYNPKTKNYFGNLLQLAQNDGFDTIEDFFNWFNEDFTGKIIHWTDFKY